MPKRITVYDVLISCPSDVGEYIDSIKRGVYRFNSTHGEYRGIILRTKYWKDDSFAQSGGKAQEAGVFVLFGQTGFTFYDEQQRI